MIKKVFSIIATAAFVLGAVPQTKIAKNLVNACSYVCCDHNGAGWSN